jgi:drug/metabolite transporter (DMT)-like permease
MTLEGSTMLALASICVYFTLNILVTITNRIIVSETSKPHLLTACHATASYASTTVLARLQQRHPAPTSRLPSAKSNLILFSFLFAINIGLSNYTLGIVSLPIHQTIRATAPVLTIVISILVGLRTWSSYNSSMYLSLIPIIFGVIVAIQGSLSDASWSGLFIAFLGAVTAVCKTIVTNRLQTNLDIQPSELILRTTPLAAIWSLCAAYHLGEFTNIWHFSDPKAFAIEEPRAWLNASFSAGLLVVNALLAAALNLASFDANRRCGPTSMAIAANMKQATLLLVFAAQLGESSKTRVFVGGLMTVVGGIWYAFTQGSGESRRARSPGKELEKRGVDRDEEIV